MIADRSAELAGPPRALRPGARAGAAEIAAQAAGAPRERLPELLAQAAALPPAEQAGDELRYAIGLMLWRLGEQGRALAAWDALAAAGEPRVRALLAAARRAHASGLLAAGKHGECLEVLGPLAPAAAASTAGSAPDLQLCLRLAQAAAHAGEPRLARRALDRVGDSSPCAAVLRAALEPLPAERTRALLAALDDPRLPPEWAARARRAASAGLALEGRLAEALDLLAVDTPDPEARVLRCLLRFALSGGRALPAPDDCDWSLLRTGCAEAPGLLAALAARPAAGDPLRQAGYWVARADLAAAVAVLAEAQRRAPGDPVLARQLAVLWFLIACRAAPRIDAPAWRGCIAQTICFLESPKWLDTWVVDRLAVYGVASDWALHTGELRGDLAQRIADRLTRLGALARTRGDDPGAEQVLALKAELARERLAARAMREAGGWPLGPGAALACGPLFAAAAGLDAATLGLFDDEPGEDGSTDAALRALLENLGLADLPGVPQAPRTPRAELRQWFSELGEAASLRAAGDLGRARESALGIYARWSPPDAPDEAQFARDNPGYARLPGGAERLRQAAAAMVCELTLEALRGELARADFDPASAQARCRTLLAEAVTLGCDFTSRHQLTRLILGKREQLAASGGLEGMRQACVLLRAAAAGGVPGLERARGESLQRQARLLAERQRYRQAVACQEEAWELDESEVRVCGNLVALLLKHWASLREDGRTEEAGAALARADQVAQQLARAFPADPSATRLPRAVEAARHGMPLDMLLDLPGVKAAPVTPLADLPQASEIVRAIRDCQAARAAGDLARAQAQAEVARGLAPDHPDLAALAAQAALELARSLPPAEGRRLHAHAEELVAPALARFPAHVHLQDAREALQRYRVWFAAAGALEELHRKALRLADSGRPEAAVELLKVVFALEPRHDPEVCALLAECLVAHAELLRGGPPPDGAGGPDDPSGPDGGAGEQIAQQLATAERVLSLGREISPEHRGMDATRRRLEELRG